MQSQTQSLVGLTTSCLVCLVLAPLSDAGEPESPAFGDSASRSVASSLPHDRIELRLQPDASDKAPTEPPKAPDSAADLATKLQNPIADLISVPFQFNWDTGIGPDDDKDKITVNIQPVIPFHISSDWNIITRTIIPVVYAEGPASGITSEFGVGDTLASAWLSPKDPIGGWILGVGAAAQVPTGTDDLFRTKQFSLGPTAIALKQDHVGTGTLTYGALVNHLWKVAGTDDLDVADVNATFLQPFLAYTLAGGTTIALNTESTYNWTSEEWSVPINLQFSQLLKIGKQPVQFQFGGRYYADTVPNGPEWGVRFTVTFLLPD